ncbi:MAG: YbaN family protein [Trueperaceae bacterium]|nr:YbaN family protein [Trueperaceae bacterium]
MEHLHCALTYGQPKKKALISGVAQTDPQKSKFTDYSHETKVVANPALRYLWLVLGFAFTGLGFLGYILPGLPGTVFILIATYFFARSSPRFYNWLMNNRLFGQLIRDWRAGMGIPMRAKITAVTVIAITIGISAYTIPYPVLKLIVVLCGVGVSIYLLTRRTKII